MRFCENQFSTVFIIAILLIIAALSNEFPENNSFSITKPYCCWQLVIFVHLHRHLAGFYTNFQLFQDDLFRHSNLKMVII